MRFRFRGVVQDLGLHQDGVSPIVFTTTGDRPLRVELRDVPGDRLELHCEVTSDFEPSSKVREASESLATNQLPVGSLSPEKWPKPLAQLDPSGRILGPLESIPMSYMPGAFQYFAPKLADELSGAARRAVGLLRWRSAELGAPQPFSSVGFAWDLGDGEWRSMPGRSSFVTILPSALLEIGADAHEDLQRLFAEGEDEPFAYELLREAWGLRNTHPRSSLLIALAGLEVGVKHYLAERDPGSEWLEAQSPSVVKLLNEQLPTLEPPVGASPLASKTEPLPQFLSKELTNRIGERNKIVHDPKAHTSAKPIATPERARSAVLAARDALLRLDVANGHVWAREHLGQPLKKEPSSGYRRIP